MNRKYPWDAMELEYIQSDIALRALATKNGMRNHSLIMEYCKKHEWVRKREEYRARAEKRQLTLLADDEGRRLARESRVRENAIDAIDEAISKLRADMSDTVKVVKDDGEVVDTGVPVMRLQPKDIAMLIDRMQVLFGRPAQITEERSLEFDISAKTDPAFLRDLVEATRGFAADPAGVVSSPLPRIEKPRPN